MPGENGEFRKSRLSEPGSQTVSVKIRAAIGQTGLETINVCV